ncbi:hypothetical protein MK489_23945 [Myxococcota bacterium]|nr:hypothetical protein [Myxococcota bacterium]
MASRTQSNVLWTHNDSGDKARIFAITLQGETLATFDVEGANHVDWEDIAVDNSGHLYIGDIGNNRNDRRELTIYRIREPDPRGGSGSVHVERILRFRYADQDTYPPVEQSTFDAESLIWSQGDLYVFTKHRSDTRTKIYRVRNSDDESIQVLDPLGEIDLGGSVNPLTGNTTAADVTPDGRVVALLTYSGIYLFSPQGTTPLPAGPVARISLQWRQTGQVESIAWVGKTLVFGNEGGDLFQIDAPLAPTWRRFPPD